jgi:hypothetical protein
MAIQRATLVSLLERAAAEPSFLKKLAADPLGTAHAAGVELSAADIKAWLALDAATDAELVEVLRMRMRPSANPDDVTGCACACDYE